MNVLDYISSMNYNKEQKQVMIYFYFYIRKKKILLIFFVIELIENSFHKTTFMFLFKRAVYYKGYFGTNVNSQISLLKALNDNVFPKTSLQTLNG